MTTPNDNSLPVIVRLNREQQSETGRVNRFVRRALAHGVLSVELREMPSALISDPYFHLRGG